MKKLLNHTEKETNEKENLQLMLKFRRDILKISAQAPAFFKNFCIEFKKNDSKMLQDFEQKVKNNEQLKTFLNKNEIICRYKLTENNFIYKDLLYKLFKVDKEYRKNAAKLIEYTGYSFLEFLYIGINYSEDNFPVISNRELKEEEKKLVKFLLYKGNNSDYINKYNVSKEILDYTLGNICDNYKYNDINTTLNLILIEKYKRKENTEFINKLKELYNL